MQYLLERLADPGGTEGPAVSAFDLREAVRRQIERLVTAHVWPGDTGLELMGMALPPVAGAGYAQQEDIGRHAAGIRALVLRHEPRLSRVRVALQKTADPLMPYRVVVTGQLSPDAPAERFEFDAPQR